MARLSNIIEHQTFFPLLFRAKLVEQCLDRLADDSLCAAAGVTGHWLTFLSGCTHAYTGLRKAFVAELDLDSLQKAQQNLKEAFSRRPGKEMWYEEFVKLTAVTALGCKDANAHSDLDDFFQNALNTERGLPEGQERNLLRYGIVDRLHFIALNGESSEIRAFAVTELMYVGTHCVTNEGWADEPAVVEAILSALHDVIGDSEHKELTETTLEVMCAQKNSIVQEILDHVSRSGERESTSSATKERTTGANALFHLVRTSIKVYDRKQTLIKSEELKKVYTDDEFATVSDFLNEKRRNVEDFQFHVVYCRGRQ